jgi:hypothetical protein
MNERTNPVEPVSPYQQEPIPAGQEESHLMRLARNGVSWVSDCGIFTLVLVIIGAIFVAGLLCGLYTPRHNSSPPAWDPDRPLFEGLEELSNRVDALTEEANVAALRRDIAREQLREWQARARELIGIAATPEDDGDAEGATIILDDKIQFGEIGWPDPNYYWRAE